MCLGFLLVSIVLETWRDYLYIYLYYATRAGFSLAGRFGNFTPLTGIDKYNATISIDDKNKPQTFNAWCSH
jgi:hypothetical protein